MKLNFRIAFMYGFNLGVILVLMLESELFLFFDFVIKI